MSRVTQRVGTKNKSARKAKVEAYYKRFRNGINKRNMTPEELSTKNLSKREARSGVKLLEKNGIVILDFKELNS